jgi:hypothetical protein
MARPHGDLLRDNTYVAGAEIKIGDFVTINSSGQVVKATASQALLGVALGYAKATGVNVQVADHPDQEYLVKKSASAPTAQTDYFLNYDIVATASAAGNYESANTLDSASGATTSTLPLRAVFDGRTATGTEAVCRINNHVERTGVAGQ